MTSSPGVSQWADSSASPVLLREYQPVRLWLSGLGFLLFLIPSLVLGWIEGFGASALLLGMFIHAAIMLRRADISVLGVLLVDVTVIGAVSILARVPVVTALGFTLLVVVTGTFARRRHARLMWLYVGALFGVVLLIHEFLGPSGLTGGQVRLVSVIAMGIQLPGLAMLVVRATGRQRSADRLERESAARYRAVFEQSPVALWDSDFSGLKDWLDGLPVESAAELRSYLAERPDEVRHGLNLIRITDLNEAVLVLFGADRREDLVPRIHPDTLTDESLGYFIEEWLGIWNGQEQIEGLSKFRTLDGEPLDVALRYTVPRNGDQLDYSKVVLAASDVTELKRTQAGLERRLVLDDVVVDVSSRLNVPASGPIDEEIQAALGVVGRSMDADRCYLIEKSDDGTTSTNSHEWCAQGVAPQKARLQNVPVGAFPWIWQQLDRRQVVRVLSVDGLPVEASAERDELIREGIQSMVNVPMVSRDRVVGLLGIDFGHSQPTSWPDDEIATFTVLQDLFANALRRKQNSEQLQTMNRVLRAVSECNDALLRAEDEESLLDEVCRVVVEVGGYRLAWVGFTDDDESQRVRPVAQRGFDDRYLEHLRVKWADTDEGGGPTATAIRTRTAVATQSIMTDPRFAPWRDQALLRGYQSTLAIPLMADDGVMGVLNVYSAEPNAFDVSEIAVLQRFADGLTYGIGALRTRARQKATEAQLRAALRAKNDLIASISHELRTPLTAVVGFAQVLLDLDPMISAKERNELIVSIAEESADLTNIVDDLLVAAKSEAGTLAVVHIPVELRPQVVQVLEGLSGVDRRRVLLDRFSAKGFGDPARLRQIFRNLLSNALRYGGPNIAIHVVSDGAEVRVLVKDDGPGIASVDRGRIFEAYARAHESTGRTFSLGLGLSISRDLAQRMDGDLTYRYERGESVFELVLPRAP